MSKIKFLQISPGDNVAVALNGPQVGHKFAVRPIKMGEKVIKYSMPIGVAVKDIDEGEQVHVVNLKTLLSDELEYVYTPVEIMPFYTKRRDSFMGFVRPDGEVGTRNDLWVIPTVGCTNILAERLCHRMNIRIAGNSSSEVRKAIPFLHPYGCSQLGGDHERTANLLASFCKHPNAGGVLVVSLGCENNTLESFKDRLGDVSKYNIRFMRGQDAGNEFEEGMGLLEELYTEASKNVRVSVPVSKLKVGLKCGASDGFSGITANPLVGRFSDMLIAQDGISVLSEVPEMFGAESLLMNRCANRQVFEKCVKMINDFKAYFLSHGQVVYENPSPGNKEGGISTLEDKSLGCTQKGGTGKVVDIKNYGEKVTVPGLNLLSGPGNDMVASTVLAASGCQLILFTTGRGTPFGTVVPTIKISSNTDLAEKKPHWIDFDAGKLLSGVTIDELGEEFFDFVIKIASGEQFACNEEYSYQEISIFKDGVTL